MEQSPFARTSAKIRNSLSTLTASLDLPPPTKQSGAASASKGDDALFVVHYSSTFIISNGH